MKKAITLILILITFGCVNKPQKEVVVTQDTVLPVVEKQLFAIKALNDTLDAFIKEIGESVFNPIGAPKVNNIAIISEGKDTLLVYIAQLGLYQMYDFEKEVSFFKGGCVISGEYIAVIYSGLTKLELSDIVNEELLDSTILEKIIDETPADTTGYDLYWTNGYQWVYRLRGDSLAIWKKIKMGDD